MSSDEIIEEVTQTVPSDEVLGLTTTPEEETVIIDDDYEATIKYFTEQEIQDEKEYDIIG